MPHEIIYGYGTSYFVMLEKVCAAHQSELKDVSIFSENLNCMWSLFPVIGHVVDLTKNLLHQLGWAPDLVLGWNGMETASLWSRFYEVTRGLGWNKVAYGSGTMRMAEYRFWVVWNWDIGMELCSAVEVNYLIRDEDSTCSNNQTCRR